MRSLFSGTSRIAGKPGAENINPDQLLWQMTKFDGEGQLILDADDDFLANRFYRSEGLNFRTPGKFELNKSTLVQSPLDSSGGTTATIQGSAFTDVTGTSTTVNTDDKRLNVALDEIQSTAHTPGAGVVQVDYYIYSEGAQFTTIEGSAMELGHGNGEVSGSDFRLHLADSRCKTDDLSGLSTVPYEVNWYTYISDNTTRLFAQYQILNVTNPNDPKTVYLSGMVFDTADAAGTKTHTAQFTPVAGKTYRFVTILGFTEEPSTRLLVDKITYGPAQDPTDSVRVSVYNSTGAAEVSGSAKTVFLTNTSTLNVVSVVYTAAAATDYKYRVRFADGQQRPIVDKTVTTIQSTSAWTLDCLELGQGGNLWLGGHRSATSPQTWIYDFANNIWDDKVALNDAANNSTFVAFAHTDKFQYALMSDNTVQQFTTAAENDYTAAMSGTATGVGMCITQDRLCVLTEDATNGVTVRTFAVDADVSGGVTAQLTSTPVTTALNTADSALRQRMTATPDGAVFYVNYSDVTTKIYQVDFSQATVVAKEIGFLGNGIKATAICFSGGLTFIAGQFQAETGQTGRSALWVLDQNNIIQRVGYFRRPDPDSRAPQYMVDYQNDLWILQGDMVWRYAHTTGGLYLEYQLDAKTPANQMALAVTQGHQFALFTEEVHVTGSVGTYRTAGQNNYLSSIYDFSLPGVRKILDRIDVLTETMPADTDVKIEYQIDNSGTWVPAATFTSGSNHRVGISTQDSSVQFSALQIRCTLGSLTGVSTPAVTAIIPRAFPVEFEEFIDLVLLCSDEDSGFHVDDQIATGADLARNIRSLCANGNYVSFVDAYDSQQLDDAPEYTVRVESFEQQHVRQGESRMVVSLRVMS